MKNVTQKINQGIALLLIYIFVGTLALPAQTIAIRPRSEDKPVTAQTTLDSKTTVETTVLKENQFQVSAKKGGTVEYAGLQLTIPAGALDQDLVITVEKSNINRELNAGMDNAMVNKAMYRLHPDGTKFNVPIMIGIPYDPNLDEESITNLSSYYYDEIEQCWVKIKRLNIDAEKHIVYSATTHFSDYINSTLKLPETPKPLSWNPNSIKDLKAADPASGIIRLQLPQLSNQGASGTAFPIDIPAGRAGMHPQLAISYSQGATNTWCGQGWDLQAPSISIDTRWGVPRFEPINESETYIVDGQEVGPIGHGNSAQLFARNTESNGGQSRQFYHLVEKSHSKIIRYGTNTGGYWWEVSSKDGKKRYYGSADNGSNFPGAIRDGLGNITRWMLVKEIDEQGNYITYSYAKIPGGPGGSYQFNLKSIRYTGHGNDLGAYEVEFITAARTDGTIDAKSGALLYTGSLLSEIAVKYWQDTIVSTIYKKYKLNYQSGVFGRSLLTSLVGCDKDGTEFYRYTCKYYDDVAGGQQIYSSNKIQIPFGQPSNSIRYDVANIGISPSFLGTSMSESVGADLYIGIGLGVEVTSKSNSVGGQLGFSYQASNKTATMMDMDGDGLPDFLYMDAQRNIHYCKQLADHSFSSAIAISGWNGHDFSSDYSFNFSFGVSAAVNIGPVGGNIYTGWAWNWSFEDCYFNDINGDGLVDIVTPDGVNYNHLENGVPSFSQDSSLTEFPLYARNIGLYNQQANNDFAQKRQDNAYQIDAVRIWTAPFSGEIIITGDPRYVDPVLSADEMAKFNAYTHRDGVNVHVQLNDIDKWSVELGTSNHPARSPDESVNLRVTVQKGDHIQFRTNTGKDGKYDVVEWVPEIKYTKVNNKSITSSDLNIPDANGRPLYVYNASDDFLTWGNTGVFAPAFNGKVSLKGAIQTGVLQDAITLQITKYNYLVTDEGKFIADSNNPIEVLCSQELPAGQENFLDFSTITSLVDIPVKVQYSKIVTELIAKTDINKKLIKINGSWQFSEMYSVKKVVTEDGRVTYDFIRMIDANGKNIVAEFPLDFSFQQYRQNTDLPQITGQNITYDSSTTKLRIQWSLPIKYSTSSADGLVAYTYYESLNNPVTVYACLKPIHVLVRAIDKNSVGSYRTLGTFDINPGLPIEGSLLNYAATGASFINQGLSTTEQLVFEVYPDSYYYEHYTGNSGLQLVSIDSPIDISSGTFDIPDDHSNFDIDFTTTEYGGTSVYLEISDGTTSYQSSNYSIPRNGESHPRVSFSGIPRGTYTLSHVPSNFASLNFTYTGSQNIQSASVYAMEALNPVGGQTGGYHGWTVIGYNSLSSNGAIALTQYKIFNQDIIKRHYDDLGNKANTQTNSNSPPTDMVKPEDIWFQSFNASFDEYQLNKGVWIGQDNQIFINERLMSSSRNGPDDYPFSSSNSLSVNVAGYQRYSTTETNNLSGGASVDLSKSFNLSIGAANVTGDTHCLSDSIDLNGDGFPDKLDSGSVTYTDATGTLGGRNGTTADSYIRTSHTNALSLNFGGSVTSIVGTPKGDKSATKENRVSASVQVSIPLNKDNENTVTSDLIDINGDGLPDRLKVENGSVYAYLNTGYGFLSNANKIGIGTSDISKSGSTFSVGYGFGFLGYMSSDGSFGGGISSSWKNSFSDECFIDINGDGLPELINTDGSSINIHPNSGLTIQPNVGGNSNRKKLSESTNTSTGANVAFTFGFSILGAVKFVFNVGVNGSLNTSIVSSMMRDVDGDGLPDIICHENDTQSNGGEKYFYYKNQWNRTNLLQSIKSPLNATYSFDYTRTGHSYDQPHSRMELVSVITNDGVVGDGIDTQKTTFSYENGFYDRLERNFYGYGKTTEQHWDNAGNALQTIIQTYDCKPSANDKSRPFVRRGLLLTQEILDASNQTIKTIQNSYKIPRTTEKIVGGNRFSVVEIQLSSTTTTISDGGNNLVSRITFQDYDDYGNPTDILDEGSLANLPINDDIEIHIDYANFDTGYNHSLASGLTVKAYDPLTGSRGTTRQRSANYDPESHLLESITQTIDANGNTATYNYKFDDGYGNLTRIESPDGYWAAYIYDLETHSRVQEISDIHGLSSKTIYYPESGLPKVSIDSNDHAELMKYDGIGRMTELWATYDLDEANLINPKPIGTVPAVAYEYHLETNQPAWALTRNKISYSPTDYATIATIIVVDGLDRPIQTKKTGVIRGNDKIKHIGFNVSGLAVYDSAGRVVAQGQPYFEETAVGGFTAFPPLKNATLKEYDAQGRLYKTRIPKLPQMGATYNGDYYETQLNYAIDATLQNQVTMATDPLGQVSRSHQDIRGNKVRIERVRTDSEIPISDRIEQTNYLYDSLGQILKVTDTKSNNITIQYDLVGRRTRLENKDSGFEVYAYDKAGNLQYTEDNRQKRIVYRYTAGKLTEVDYSDHGPTTYVYGKNKTTNENGRIIAINTPFIKTTLSYGKLGETTSVDKNIWHQTAWTNYHLGYGFDYLGRAQYLVYPNGERVDYGYDQGGQIISVTGKHLGGDFNYVSDIGYDEFGQKTYIRYGNGVETNYRYDAVQRWLANVQTVNQAQNTTFQNTDFTFDAVGNIQSITNNAQPKSFTQNYTYDDLYQLKTAKGTYTDTSIINGTVGSTYNQLFTYDVLGNLTQKTSSATLTPKNAAISDLTYTLNYNYDQAHPHRPAKIGTDFYTYDEVGNLTSIDSNDVNNSSTNPTQPNMAVTPDTPGHGSANTAFGTYDNGVSPTPGTGSSTIASFTWDSENRLTYSKMRGTEAWYTYDMDGQRISKRSAQRQTLYPDKTYQEIITAYPAQSISHIFLGTQRIASKVGLAGQTTPYYELDNTFYYHADHLGSTEWVTNSKGQGYEHFLYTPHGEAWVTEDPDKLRYIEYRYSGKELDEETGFYYYGARYRNPKTGLWLSTDPALAEYLPTAGGDNSKLPGFGGVFNPINLGLYHFAGNNPIRYVDPDGRITFVSQLGADGEFKTGEFLKNNGYTLFGENKNVNTVGPDFIAYKDGQLYVIDNKESMRLGKVIYSVKGFESAELKADWLRKMSKAIKDSPEAREAFAKGNINYLVTSSGNVKAIGPKLRALGVGFMKTTGVALNGLSLITGSYFGTKSLNELKDMIDGKVPITKEEAYMINALWNYQIYDEQVIWQNQYGLIRTRSGSELLEYAYRQAMEDKFPTS